MPEDGITLTEKERLLSSNEVVKLARLFVSEGVDKIRLTGGEPMVRKDIIQIIGQSKINISSINNNLKYPLDDKLIINCFCVFTNI